MKTLDTCLSPKLTHLYDVRDKTVVIVDILRATSCMVTGIANGVRRITPFADLEECRMMGRVGYVIAGERNGEKVDGFDIGNSPYNYLEEEMFGEKIAVTTTNGTQAIHNCREAKEVLIGAFLNLSALAEYLKRQERSLLIVCAGWKGRVNLEDSLFAGALAEKLADQYDQSCDATLMVKSMYADAKGDLVDFLRQSSHAERLKKLNIEKDIEFCLRVDEYKVIPVLSGTDLVKL